MIVKVTGKKLGTVEFLIDEEDYIRLKDYSFYAWSTPRHNGIYINCYAPDNKKDSLRLQRLIMGAQKGQIVDHINGNPLDNRRRNLRITNYTGNNQNATKRKDGITSKYKGVSTYGNRWKAQIQYNKKKKHIGYYNTELEAAIAYNEAAVKYHGEYAKVNKC